MIEEGGHGDGPGGRRGGRHWPTANDADCGVASNGYTYEPGPIDVRITNELPSAVTIEVLDPDGEVAASATALAAGASIDKELDLGAGDHTLRCSDGTLTWDSTGTGDTPSGIMTGSGPYPVGQ